MMNEGIKKNQSFLYIQFSNLFSKANVFIFPKNRERILFSLKKKVEGDM